jgi:hypothetical protein
MTYIFVFIALVLLSNQGEVYYETIDKTGKVERVQGIPPKIIEAMIAADCKIPQENLNFSEDILKDLDEINNIYYDPHDDYC